MISAPAGGVARPGCLLVIAGYGRSPGPVASRARMTAMSSALTPGKFRWTSGAVRSRAVALERLSGPRHSVERVQGSAERGPGAGRVLMCAAPAPYEQAHQAEWHRRPR